jgi:quercetin dioxygenase-like cupin family protein
LYKSLAGIRSVIMNRFGNFLLVPPGEGRTLAVAGGRYTIKASGENTNGAYTLIEMFLPPQSGPMPHLHQREEESFYILEGSLLFQVGDETLTAGAGAFVKAPRGVSHAFKNVGTTPARVLLLVIPAGLERFFEEVGQPLGETPSLPNLEKVKQIAPRYGITILSSD